MQSHISEPIGQHMTSHPPPHSVTFFAFLRPFTDIFPLPNIAFLDGAVPLSCTCVRCP